MFAKLPEAFKKFDLAVDVRALLLLQRAMDKGLVRTIGDLFNVLRTFIIKDPEHMGPFFVPKRLNNGRKRILDVWKMI